MVVATLKRYASWALTALGALLGLTSLVLLARSVENSTQFGRWQPWILLLNLLALVFIAVVLARKLWQLARDFRDHVPGSRLTARTVTVFGVLVIAPLLVVYLFSLDFLNRGIDSWFRVEVKQGLGDALVLSRAALDLRMREQGPAHGGFRARARERRHRAREPRRRAAPHRRARDHRLRSQRRGARLEQRRHRRNPARAAAHRAAAADPREPART